MLRELNVKHVKEGNMSPTLVAWIVVLAKFRVQLQMNTAMLVVMGNGQMIEPLVNVVKISQVGNQAIC